MKRKLGIFRPQFNPFSTKGRIGRAEFAVCFAIYCAVMCGFFTLLFRAFPPDSPDNSMENIVYWVGSIVLSAPLLMQAAKRWHDMDLPSWGPPIPFWAFFFCLGPFLLYQLLHLLFEEGTVGPNRYDEGALPATPEGGSAPPSPPARAEYKDDFHF